MDDLSIRPGEVANQAKDFGIKQTCHSRGNILAPSIGQFLGVEGQ